MLTTTTANLCEAQLLNSLNIYVGTHIGSFKVVKIFSDGSGDPHKAVNIHSSTDIEKTGKVTTLEWANREHTELFLGKENQFLKVYNLSDNLVTNNVLLGGVPVGCVRINSNVLAAGLANGNIQLVDLTSVDGAPHLMSTGDHMTRMRHCENEPNIVATGGKSKANNIKIWDLEAKKQLFASKNVRPNDLQLEMPIWDNDISFISDSSVATCSRHGYIRLYDTRSQRRPVSNFQSSDRDQFSFTSLVTEGFKAYVGLTVGGLQCYDLRQLKRAAHVYKAAVGSISDVSLAGDNGQFLVSSSLDRFVRIHSTDTNALVYQSYMKTKVTRVLCNKMAIASNDESDLGSDEIGGQEEELVDILDQLPVAVSYDEPKRRRKH